jgi:POT family proton-dependent oligopeptide transporter
MASGSFTGAQREPAWFGQPPGLTILFLTEMWEKFSFYGMRALLVYYMVKGLGFDPVRASLVYGGYTAIVYLTPIAGGQIADRWLGPRRAVVLGGSIMAAGHFMMAFEPLFFAALATIAIGNGLFLPNLPSQVEPLYKAEDPRRGSAYSVYYVGVNLGALLAPLVCGTLGELYGWHWGFGAAGLGMLAGLLIYMGGARWLGPEPERTPAVAGAPFRLPPAAHLLAGVLLAVVIFRGAYEQMGNSLALWADSGVDRMAGGFAIPATWFQALNPGLVFVLTPLLVRWWTGAARAGREPAPLAKMATGAVGLALAYLALAVVVSVVTGQVHWLWLAAFIAVYTLAELFILPIGLGLFARMAPDGRKATAIAAWFLAAFFGNLLAGTLGSLWTRLGPAPFFALMAATAALSALLLVLLAGRAKGLSDGR